MKRLLLALAVLLLPLCARAQDTISVTCSEDYYNGDALFSVVIDSLTVSVSTACTARNNPAGVQPTTLQTSTFTGNYGGTGTAHVITVTFLNDLYSGTPQTDRNLYVNAVTFDGQMPTGVCSGGGYQKVFGAKGCYLASTGDKGQWSTVIAAPGPTISTVLPSSGPASSVVTVSGSNFGATQGTSSVLFNGASAGIANNWSATAVAATVPINATTGNVTINVAGVVSNGVLFTVTPAPGPNPPTVTSIQVSTVAALACGPQQPAPSQHSVLLSWTASTTAGVSTYNVYRSVTSGSGYVKIGATTGGALTYTDTTASSGGTYYYVVTALSGTSESTWSNQASASIP
jgi:hypothetical protein